MCYLVVGVFYNKVQSVHDANIYSFFAMLYCSVHAVYNFFFQQVTSFNVSKEYCKCIGVVFYLAWTFVSRTVMQVQGLSLVSFMQTSKLCAYALEMISLSISPFDFWGTYSKTSSIRISRDRERCRIIESIYKTVNKYSLHRWSFISWIKTQIRFIFCIIAA